MEKVIFFLLLFWIDLHVEKMLKKRCSRDLDCAITLINSIILFIHFRTDYTVQALL